MVFPFRSSGVRSYCPRQRKGLVYDQYSSISLNDHYSLCILCCYKNQFIHGKHEDCMHWVSYLYVKQKMDKIKTCIRLNLQKSMSCLKCLSLKGHCCQKRGCPARKRLRAGLSLNAPVCEVVSLLMGSSQDQDRLSTGVLV